jgi:hypothetical protein
MMAPVADASFHRELGIAAHGREHVMYRASVKGGIAAWGTAATPPAFMRDPEGEVRHAVRPTEGAMGKRLGATHE